MDDRIPRGNQSLNENNVQYKRAKRTNDKEEDGSVKINSSSNQEDDEDLLVEIESRSEVSFQ